MSEIVVATDPGWDEEKHGKTLCDRFGAVLAHAYPGYRWRIDAKPAQGIVDVRCEHATCYAGYTFNLRRYGLPDDAAIRRAGGEVLERYGLWRRGFSESQYRSLPRWCGQIRPEW